MSALQRGINSVKRLTAVPRTVAMQAQSWVTQNLFGPQGVVHPTPPDTTKIFRTPIVTPISARPAFAQTVFVTNLLLTTLAGTSVSVTPATASLTTTRYAPTVTATNIKPFMQTAWDNPVLAPRRTQAYESRGTDRFYGAVSATPTTASLATTGYAPTVTASDHKTVTPTTATLTTTGYAPSVTATGGSAPFAQADWLNPRGRAWLYVPQSHRYAGTPVSNTVVIPTAATLTLTGYAPTVTNGVVVVPFSQIDWPNPRINPRYKQQPAGGRVLGEEPFPFTQTEWPNPNRRVLAKPAFTQSVSYTLVPVPVSITPTTATLTTTGYAPTITASDHKTVTPSTATLTTTGYAPTITVESASRTVIPTTATLTLMTYAPTVTATVDEPLGFYPGGGGDDAPPRTKKRTRTQLVTLANQLDATVRETLRTMRTPAAPPATTPIPVSQIVSTYETIQTQAAEFRTMQAQVAALREQMQRYQQALLDADDAEWEWFL